MVTEHLQNLAYGDKHTVSLIMTDLLTLHDVRCCVCSVTKHLHYFKQVVLLSQKAAQSFISVSS